MKSETYQNLTIAALDRLRVQQFGAETLRLFQMTPEAGETLVSEITDGWGGHRIAATTDSVAESGAWQFQVKAADDWPVEQAFMPRIVALKIGARRWKVKKIEAPVGNSLVWKIKAEVQ